MKKLDDIPKNGFFEPPDGYFDRLPGIIQARVAEVNPRQAERPYIRYALRYALPVVLFAAISIFLIRPKTTPGAEDMLASVSTTDLVSYLEETDVTVEQLLNAIEVNDDLVDAIEEEVYSLLPLDDLESDVDFDLDTI
ncbi:hypothetical protein QQ054_13870 [Oscillatoria amoena NRMC-F 0135]|nr:hypothetical protein [Oscillatoria amoena NRMC-F 0135]